MVHMYAVKITENIDNDIIENFVEMISPERKERVGKYRNLKDKQRGILAEVILRYALYQHYSLKSEIVFGYNEYGKPFLKGFENIFFNMSHSGDWVLCGVGDVPIGVDVEQIAQADLKIAKRFFCESENSYLLSLEEAQQNTEFFKIWTLKESYIKKVGSGLNMPLNSFSFAFPKDRILLYEQNGVRKDLQFAAGKLDNKHWYSICIRSDTKQIFTDDIYIISFHELIAFSKISSRSNQ